MGALVLVRDDSSGICGWRAGHFGVEIDIKHPVLVIADFGNLVVAQGCRDGRPPAMLHTWNEWSFAVANRWGRRR